MFEYQLSETTRHFGEASERHRGSADENHRTPSSPAGRELSCTHDLDGLILSVNPGACAALGISAGSLRGKRIPDLLPGIESGFADYMRTVQREGFASGMMKVETPGGGGRIWEYRSTLDASETPAIVRGIARDVTDREESFHEVRRSEDYFRSIIENASDVIAIVGLDGGIRYGSPSFKRVLGYSRKTLAGMFSLDLIHPDDRKRANEFLTRQIANPASTRTMELRARHQSGSWRSFEVVATNLVRNGKTSAVIVNARDITERKLLEAQLVQAKRLGGLGRLAATVAHEFNNVLMGMQPFAELMQRPDAPSPIVTKGAGHIANSIQRGRRIVLDILRFTQPYEPVTTAVDLGEWWENFLPEAEAVLGNMISVKSTIPKRGLCVVADRTQLSQVLANLVANARDAMSAGGTFTVSASELNADAKFPFGVVPDPDRFVQITVRDTGQGMPADVMERIFEPLYTTKQSGGTGLGLAVAHQVMTQHGGYIFVESEPGRGSTFHLFLPKAAPPAADIVAGSNVVNIPTGCKLLIIDDEETIVEGIAALLEQDGIVVEGINSGLKAAQAIARFHPDVVLLDFGLPDMDGSEVYALIRELEPDLPIIFATGHGDRRVLHDSLNDPCTRFLQKPFEASSLLQMMVELESGRAQ